jgi:hypothetical protein
MSIENKMDVHRPTFSLVGELHLQAANSTRYTPE